MIEARDLAFAYAGGAPLFEGLSFRVPDGGMLVLRGPSGSGKSTLLYCLCGVIPRNISGNLRGGVSIDGRPVRELSASELARSAAMIFQEPGGRIFLPAAEDELAFTPENMRVAPPEMRGRIDRAAELAGLAGKLHENPAKLSGGQLKLLALAGVLVYPPRVLLLDEISAGLDSESRGRVRGCVSMLRDQGCAIIAGEHDARIWEGEDELRI